MKTHRTLMLEIRANYSTLALILAISGFFLSVVAWAHWRYHIPLGDMTRDAASVIEAPFYIGFLSDLGILCWGAATTLCFFTAHVVAQQQSSSQLKSFLYASGALSLLLTLDDMFMLHEEVFPKYIGIPDQIVYLIYLALGVAYLVRFRLLILQKDYSLLGCAVLFLGLSVVLDALPLPRINPFLFEDGAKFVGIVSWLIYFIRLSNQALQRSKSSPPV